MGFGSMNSPGLWTASTWELSFDAHALVMAMKVPLLEFVRHNTLPKHAKHHFLEVLCYNLTPYCQIFEDARAGVATMSWVSWSHEVTDRECDFLTLLYRW